MNVSVSRLMISLCLFALADLQLMCDRGLNIYEFTPNSVHSLLD